MRLKMLFLKLNINNLEEIVVEKPLSEQVKLI